MTVLDVGDLEDGAGGTTMDLMANPICFDLTSNSGFALALNEVRRLRKGGCAIIAICCESFSSMWLHCSVIAADCFVIVACGYLPVALSEHQVAVHQWEECHLSTWPSRL